MRIVKIKSKIKKRKLMNFYYSIWILGADLLALDLSTTDGRSRLASLWFTRRQWRYSHLTFLGADAWAEVIHDKFPKNSFDWFVIAFGRLWIRVASDWKRGPISLTVSSPLIKMARGWWITGRLHGRTEITVKVRDATVVNQNNLKHNWMKSKSENVV